ncbi:MAG: hypothetical protein R2729_23415 [Bryobacteraceae bacterium]
MSIRQLLALLLALSVTGPALVAETPVSKPREEGGLKIFVLQGAGAMNSVQSRTATQPVVEVRDELNRPVRGAEVLFSLPESGPGGYFNGQKLGWTGRTDGNGQVAALPFLPNDQAGRFNIQVSALYGNRSGSVLVPQINSLRPVTPGVTERKGVSGWWKAVAIIGGAAAAGAVVWGVRRGNRPDVVLQPGPIAVGGPR